MAQRKWKRCNASYWFQFQLKLFYQQRDILLSLLQIKWHGFSNYFYRSKIIPKLRISFSFNFQLQFECVVLENNLCSNTNTSVHTQKWEKIWERETYYTWPITQSIFVYSSWQSHFIHGKWHSSVTQIGVIKKNLKQWFETKNHYMYLSLTYLIPCTSFQLRMALLSTTIFQNCECTKRTNQHTYRQTRTRTRAHRK